MIAGTNPTSQQPPRLNKALIQINAVHQWWRYAVSVGIGAYCTACTAIFYDRRCTKESVLMFRRLGRLITPPLGCIILLGMQLGGCSPKTSDVPQTPQPSPPAATAPATPSTVTPSRPLARARATRDDFGGQHLHREAFAHAASRASGRISAAPILRGAA